MNKILIIVPNWIGDALFASAALRLIKQNHPNAQCFVLAVPRAAEVFGRNPDVAGVIVNADESKPFWYPLVLSQKIRRLHFDATFILHRSRSRAILAFLAGIPLRVGFDTKHRGMFLTHAVALPSSTMHRVEDWRHLLHQAGIVGAMPSPVFVVGPAAREKMRARVGDQEYAILNPGGNWLPKRWPTQCFAQLADLLATRLGLRLVITGADGDRALADEIQQHASVPLLSLAGETNLEELGAVIERSRLFISNDSGPLHLAAAVGTPVIALFGPTSAKITGPVGDGEIIVLQKDIGLPVPNPDPLCRDMRYMEAISVEEVFAVVQKIVTIEHIPFVRSKRSALQTMGGVAVVQNSTSPFPSLQRRGKHILFITLSNIGDAVLTTPVLQKLLDRQDSPRVSVLAGPKVAEIFQHDPAIEEVIVYDKLSSWKGKWTLARELRGKGFDEVVDLRHTLFPVLILGWRALPQLFRRRAGSGHQVQRHLQTAFGKGAADAQVQFRLHVPNEIARAADALLAPLGKEAFLVIAPGAASDLKRWPLERFAEIIARSAELCSLPPTQVSSIRAKEKRIKNRLWGRAGVGERKRVVLVGGPENLDLGERLCQNVGESIVNLIGKTTLLELAAVLQRSSLLLSNDSGPMHIAAAVGTPVVAIFGPSDAKRYGPYGDQHRIVRLDLPCSPCGQAQCPLGTHACMRDLQVEQVWDGMQSSLREVRHCYSGGRRSNPDQIVTPLRDSR